VQSTTYKYESSEELAGLFDLTQEGHMYSRISNPTVAAVEAKIAALEGGVGAMMTSSGQAASLLSILNITSAGENILAAHNLYGGTTNLFSVTLKRLGIDVRFFSQEMADSEIEAMMDDKTRLIFTETLSNPSLQVLDIERMANLAHKHSLPLIVDNTFTTPIICRPFEFGADIVVHSTSKYMDGHATVVGGVIVDSGKFDWSGYPALTEPDESYHGVRYVKDFGAAAYITKARVQLMRDFGVTPQAMTGFILNLGLETLALRVERHSQNADKVERYLENHPKVDWVN
jgi:O-acetylhomoserine (thiol)-lyase